MKKKHKCFNTYTHILNNTYWCILLYLYFWIYCISISFAASRYYRALQS